MRKRRYKKSIKKEKFARISTLNNNRVKKESEETAFQNEIFALFGLCLNQAARTGQTDLVQKSSADEREAYKGTPSEETRIE